MEITREHAEGLVHQGPCSAAIRGLSFNEPDYLAYNKGVCPFCDLSRVLLKDVERVLDIISCQNLDEAFMLYRHFLASHGQPTKVIASKHRWKRWMGDLEVELFQGIPVELIE